MAKILVIEDTLESALLARRILVDQNHEVILAATGEEGLTIARKLQPDMILLDLGLPDIAAETIAERLRTDDKLSGTPVIVVSAWPEYEVRRITQDYGLNEYIRKPFDVDFFVGIIQNHLV
jgi:DNA-binding response OmpR family regulator